MWRATRFFPEPWSPTAVIISPKLTLHLRPLMLNRAQTLCLPWCHASTSLSESAIAIGSSSHSKKTPSPISQIYRHCSFAHCHHSGKCVGYPTMINRSLIGWVPCASFSNLSNYYDLHWVIFKNRSYTGWSLKIDLTQ